jgi:hypothetical protein
LFQLHPVFKFWASQGTNTVKPLALHWHLFTLGPAAVLFGARLCVVRWRPLSSPELWLAAWIGAMLLLYHAHKLPGFEFIPYTPLVGATLPSTMFVLGAGLFRKEWFWGAGGGIADLDKGGDVGSEISNLRSEISGTATIQNPKSKIQNAPALTPALTPTLSQRERAVTHRVAACGLAAVVLAGCLGSAVWVVKIVRNLAYLPEHYVPVAVREADAWLSEHVGREDVILSTLPAGNRMARHVSARFVLGHINITPHVKELSPLIEQFYRGELSDGDARALLDEMGVRWIYFGPHERGQGERDLLTLPGMIERFANDKVRVYERK